jgi:hypothetical protein
MAAEKDKLGELEQFFKSVPLPKQVELEKGIIIKNVPKFIESHLAVLQHAGEKPVFESFWTRLRKLREIIADAG